MSRPKTVLGILRIIGSSNGQLDTRIRLQKEAFLLAVKGCSFFDVDDFDYHHYGPYSRTVSEALRFAVSMGFLAEEITYFEDISKYSYKLTSDGERFLSSSPEFAKADIVAVGIMNVEHWRSLELAATVRFLEIREGMSDRETAFSEAIRLKPATAQFRDNASAVLNSIS